MNPIYGLDGCVLVALGLWHGVRTIHKLINGTGATIQILGADMIFILLGIALILSC